jgi:hypothetical protein
MSLLLVLFQNERDLPAKGRVDMLQTLGYVLMYGRFADAKDCGGLSDGVFCFDDIFGKSDRPIPCVSFQK